MRRNDDVEVADEGRKQLGDVGLSPTDLGESDQQQNARPARRWGARGRADGSHVSALMRPSGAASTPAFWSAAPPRCSPALPVSCLCSPRHRGRARAQSAAPAVVLGFGLGLLGSLALALARFDAAVALGVFLLAVVRVEPAPPDLIFAVVIAVAFVDRDPRTSSASRSAVIVARRRFPGAEPPRLLSRWSTRVAPLSSSRSRCTSASSPSG